MNPPFNTNGLKSLFRYPFQGKEWGRKLLYLGLFWLAGSIVPVVPWLFALGYFAEIVRRVVNDEAELGLPEWTDWNRLLMDGLRVLGAGLIVCLPIAAIFFLGFSFYFGTTLTTVGLGESGREDLIFIPLMGGMMVLFCSMAVGTLLSFGLGIVSAPSVTHMLVKKEFAALFRFKEWWRVLRANLGGFLIAFFIILGLYFVFQMLTGFVIYSVVLCGLLPVLGAVVCPYLTVISAVLFGQAYREGRDTLAANPAEELLAEGI